MKYMFNWYKEKNPNTRFNNNMIEGLADEPQDKMVSLDKACGWLNSVDMRMYVIADHTSSNINRFAINKFISDFRKAMED